MNVRQVLRALLAQAFCSLCCVSLYKSWAYVEDSLLSSLRREYQSAGDGEEDTDTSAHTSTDTDKTTDTNTHKDMETDADIE